MLHVLILVSKPHLFFRVKVHFLFNFQYIPSLKIPTAYLPDFSPVETEVKTCLSILSLKKYKHHLKKETKKSDLLNLMECAPLKPTAHHLHVLRKRSFYIIL